MATLKAALRHLLAGPIGAIFWVLLAVLVALTLLPRANLFDVFANYLAFHSIIELLCVMVALMAALAIFNSYRALSSQYLCAGCLLALSALFDSLHLLSMPGMPALLSPNTLSKAIYLWLAGRLCVIVALLLLALSRHNDAPCPRPLSVLALFALAGASVATVTVLFHAHLPAMYIDGAGLTPFKIASEWGLVALSVTAGMILLRSARMRQRVDRELLAVAAWTTGLAEICFTLYGAADDEFNVVGHVYKAISYALLFRALFLSHLRYPWQAMAESQQRLTYQEQRWNLALTGADTGVWDFDLSEDRIFSSAQFHDMLGYRHGEMPREAHLWRERLIHPDDSEQMLASFDRHARGETAHWRCEYRMLDAHGDWRWVLSNGQAMIFNDAGQPTRVVGTTIDIQTRREQDKRLEEVKQRLQRIFDAAPMGMLVIDGEGRVWQHNHIVKTLLGRAPQECERVDDWVPAEARESLLTQWQQWRDSPEIRRDKTWRRELRLLGNDETDIWTEWQITSLPEQNLYLLMIEDISVRRRATELLTENASLYRSTFESGNAIKLLLDPDSGRIVDANPAASHYYGHTPEAMKNLYVTDISTTPEKLRSLHTRRTLEARSDHFETRHRLADGSERDVEVFVAPVMIEGRELFYEMVHDISARKQAEMSLNALNRRLERYGDHLQRLHELSAELFSLDSVNDVVPLLEEALPTCFADARGEIALRLEDLPAPCTISWGGVMATAPNFEYRQRLVTATGALGLLRLQAEPEDDNDRLRLERMVDETARMITLTLINLRQRRQLTDHAYRDALTGLYNRRYLNETLPKLLAECRPDFPLALILLDLDHFKRLNDSYGHEIGDQVLVALARLLGERLRHTDIPCRYGGEEFIVVMPGASAEIARKRMESMLEHFGQWQLTLEDGRRIEQLSFSAGLSVATRAGYPMNELIEQADRALYGAKHAGRARVMDIDSLPPA
ncbi:MASE3 domain-containing protein [Kushneria aurantia]|uniref:MASE3 domain-containing protein n=1 Tax=Kushneria aurantia TaxID=504092 RepID=A0ABV6G9C3_9GAMM|nr:MASE3 domain-containing protein [Kushneria aurantia]